MAYTLPGKKTKAFLEHCKTHFKHGLTYDLDAKRANSRGFRPPAQIMLDRAKGDFIWDLDGNIKANYEVINGERYGLIGLKKCFTISDNK